MSTVNETLQTRQHTHGDYHEQAEMFDTLLKTLMTGVKWCEMTCQERAGLIMATQKASRIVCGNPHEPDHWHDIAGYATLVEKDILVTRGHAASNRGLEILIQSGLRSNVPKVKA